MFWNYFLLQVVILMVLYANYMEKNYYIYYLYLSTSFSCSTYISTYLLKYMYTILLNSIIQEAKYS